MWTDELGTLVQGVGSRQLTSHFEDVLELGKVYFVTQFGQGKAKRRWRPFSNDRLLQFTSSTAFLFFDEDDAAFCIDSFEFRPFEALHGLLSTPGTLVDAVGRLLSASPITFFQPRGRSIKKQTIVIENERKASLAITLWEEFADRLRLPDLIQMDEDAPVVDAFTSIKLSI